MADHYARFLEYLDEIEDCRQALRNEYARGDLQRREKIADLHQRLGQVMKLADLHIQAAKVGGIYDVHALLDDRLPLIEPVRVQL